MFVVHRLWSILMYCRILCFALFPPLDVIFAYPEALPPSSLFLLLLSSSSHSPSICLPLFTQLDVTQQWPDVKTPGEQVHLKSHLTHTRVALIASHEMNEPEGKMSD